jgi:hypothetical protein
MEPKKHVHIDSWTPKKHQIFAERNGKLFMFYFEKIFDSPNLKVLDTFTIIKKAYVNDKKGRGDPPLTYICNYINYFINFYDEDNELALAYLKLKYSLDKQKKFNEENMDAFIDFIYEVLFTPTMVEKIVKLVNDNYIGDIESSTDDKKKYIKSMKKHLESLEFTNQHVKILLMISFGIKIMSLVIFHFTNINQIKMNKDSDILFKFYQRLFPLFGYSNLYILYNQNGEILEEDVSPDVIEEGVKNCTLTPIKTDDGYETMYYLDDGERYYTLGKINMYNKLFVYVKAKILESNSNNSLLFEQREIFGDDIYTIIHKFTNNVLISDTMFKYTFDNNVIGFNKTIIKYQLGYFLRYQYQKNITEITKTENSDGLSGVDKMAMNLTKLDEGITTFADINIEKTIERIQRIMGISISQDEIDYYRYNQYPSPIQIQLINSYFTKYFGAYRDLNLLTRRQYIILMLLLKKKLLKELGFENNDEIYQAALPYILTGNLESKVNTRLIRNNRFISKIEESYLYQNLINNKYAYLQQIKPDYILSLVSSLINTKFSYVTYENTDLLGQEIEYSEDMISDELLFFLNSI